MSSTFNKYYAIIKLLRLQKAVKDMNKQEYLKKIDLVIASGKYKDNWQSLSEHKTPEWFSNGKFGIFIHWGVYSVPAFGNEWYARSMYDINSREFAHHIEKYGKQSQFGYKDFIPMFRAEKFEPSLWADLFRKSGARYVMPVAEHHDGFAMYDTAFNRWNSTEMGPKRDVISELKTACEDEGLVFCLSNHRAEHYFFMNLGRTFDSDVNDERFQDFYGPAYFSPEFDSKHMTETTENTFSSAPTEEYLEDWLVRMCEMVDKFQPKIVYFDWWIHNHGFKPYLKKFAAYYYNTALERGEEVTINYKYEAFAPGTATFDVERGALTGISPVSWQTDTAVAKNSWGYTDGNEYKSSNKIICDLIDIVSKNGNLLLNIGPKSDGTITDEETKVLLEIGDWLSENGEGIYGTTYWKIFGEGEVNVQSGFFMDNEEKPFTENDFRFTYKKGFVYAFQMKPNGKDAKIKAFAKQGRHDFLVKSVALLSDGEPLQFERNDEYMTVKANEKFRCENPICFKIEID